MRGEERNQGWGQVGSYRDRGGGRDRDKGSDGAGARIEQEAGVESGAGQGHRWAKGKSNVIEVEPGVRNGQEQGHPSCHCHRPSLYRYRGSA